MLVCSNRAARHLISANPITITDFPDGELAVQLNTHSNTAYVVAATPAPGDTFLELLLILDELKKNNTKNIHLFFSYCGYTRHTQSAALLLNLLTRYPIVSTTILHPHDTHQLQTHTPFKSLIPYDFFIKAAAEYDCIAAPDNGALALAHEIGRRTGKEVIAMSKQRTQDSICVQQVSGNPQGKRVLLVDDMIATGNTVIEAATMLKQAGATAIGVAATHGLFVENAHEKIAESPIEQLFVTNSLAQDTIHGHVYNLNRLISNQLKSIQQKNTQTRYTIHTPGSLL